MSDAGDIIEVGDLVEVYPARPNLRVRLDLCKLDGTKRQDITHITIEPGTSVTGVVTYTLKFKTKYIMGLNQEGYISYKGYRIFHGDYVFDWHEQLGDLAIRVLMKSNGTILLADPQTP